MLRRHGAGGVDPADVTSLDVASSVLGGPPSHSEEEGLGLSTPSALVLPLLGLSATDPSLDTGGPSPVYPLGHEWKLWDWIYPPTLTGRLHIEPEKYSGAPLCKQNRVHHLAGFKKAVLRTEGADGPYLLGRPVRVVEVALPECSVFSLLHSATSHPRSDP
eukprot:3089225-Amphidinium_carterae.1